MKRPLLLPLAIALALGGTNALALGLGTIHVNSKLNQPLDAEIPVLQGTQGEAEGLLVQLAAAEDFDRVGLNRSRLSVPLEFSLVKNPHGEMVIKVTSKEVVREPFLDFLVEANWPKGRLLREYTVLLDPPIMAPATGTTAVAQAPKAPPERAPAPPPTEKPKAAPPPPKSAPVAVAPRPEKPAPPPKAVAAAPAPKAAASGEYKVEAGDTLSGIAREIKSEDSTNINQLMLALLKQNPNAFYKDNINALKRGAILRIPSADQVKAVGSATEAAAMVHSQIEDWRGGAAAKPTLVADTGTAPEAKAKPPATKPNGSSSTASTTPKSGNEHLELVPPKAGKDSVAMNDRPGSGAGSSSNAGSSETKAELARTKEALASREQETGELKSRVKELEDTKSKSDRLITLKDSEIADLQKKLKDLQDQSKSGAKATTSTPPPATTTTTSPPPATTPSTTTTTPSTTGKTDSKVSKEDIWGTASTPSEGKTSTTPSTTGTSTTTPATTPSTTASSTATTPPSTPAGTTPSTTTTGSGTASTTPAASGTTPPATTTPSASTSTTPSSTTTPSDTTAASTSTPPASTAESTPPKPAATTAPVKTTKTTTQPMPSGTPAWYDQAWVKPAAIGAAALLLLAGLLSMRRRKAAVAAAERGSIAGAFGESPLRDDGEAAFAAGDEEHALREQIEADPANLGLHLELLSLLYAERNVTAFEDAAEVMHMHVVDAYQPEWLEAKAMGQGFAPHSALFADGMATMPEYDDEAITAPHATAMPFYHDEVFRPHDEPTTPPAHANTAFDFDLDAGSPAAKPAPAAAAEPPFAFDNLPPIDFSNEAQHEIEAAAPAPIHVDEDEFAGEDGVGTKLDLAKAYLDMGDPEGARSMLEEVLSEGNDSQKGEARRLMAELR